MPNPVVIADLEARFRPLTDPEQSVAQALLDDAWAILLTRRPSLEQQITDGTVADASVRVVVAAMVLRVLRNPNGVKSWTVDDYSETRDNSLAAGALYVSDDELGLISPGGTGDGAFSIRPSGATGFYQPDPWLPYVLP